MALKDQTSGKSSNSHQLVTRTHISAELETSDKKTRVTSRQACGRYHCGCPAPPVRKANTALRLEVSRLSLLLHPRARGPEFHPRTRAHGHPAKSCSSEGLCPPTPVLSPLRAPGGRGQTSSYKPGDTNTEHEFSPGHFSATRQRHCSYAHTQSLLENRPHCQASHLRLQGATAVPGHRPHPPPRAFPRREEKCNSYRGCKWWQSSLCPVT